MFVCFLVVSLPQYLKCLKQSEIYILCILHFYMLMLFRENRSSVIRRSAHSALKPQSEFSINPCEYVLPYIHVRIDLHVYSNLEFTS